MMFKKNKSVPHYRFNVDPKKYIECQNFVVKLKKLLPIEYKYNVFDHYIAIDSDEKELYEIYTRVIGFEGEYTHTRAVEDFVVPPKKISIDEFFEIADREYNGISVLFEGINKDNLEQFQLIFDFWCKIPEKRKQTINVNSVDRTQIGYEFKQSYENRDFINSMPRIYPLTALSDYLLKKGFTFVKAEIGGGVDEISHTGSIAYEAKYTDFEKFRNGFENDLETFKENARIEYGGWACSPDYNYINATLKRGKLSVSALLLLKQMSIVLEWKNLDNCDYELIDGTNEEMKKILVDKVDMFRHVHLR